MANTKKLIFGTRGDIPDNVEESRIIPFVLSSFAKDRHGTVLNQDNWNLDNYRNNPIVAYQHNLTGGLCSDPDPDFVVGKSIREYFEGKGKEKRLISDAQFEPGEINPLSEKIFRKVLFGSLSRSSVGFLEVGEGHYGEGEEDRDGVNETYYFEGQELLEWSVVNIPSNPEAGKRELRRVREEAYGALMYAFKELGGRFRLSQIEQFSIRDIFDLFEGKDLDLKERDPERLRKLLADSQAKAELLARQNEMLRKIIKGLKG